MSETHEEMKRDYCERLERTVLYLRQLLKDRGFTDARLDMLIKRAEGED
jgi:hypothetical protein